MRRRGILAGVGALSMAWLIAGPAVAQESPSFAGKTITMTIGFGAGGSVDLYGRTLGQYLVQHLPGHPSLWSSTSSAPAAWSRSIAGPRRRSRTGSR